MARAIAADVFLGLAAAIVLISAIGVLVMPSAYDKLHYVTPAALLAPVAVGVAVLISSGWSSESAQTWLTILLLMIAGPFLSHATIRAARIRHTGDWRPAEREEGK
jgi:multisubunit Na+/H+ antiporter MnhG subunit